MILVVPYQSGRFCVVVLFLWYNSYVCKVRTLTWMKDTVWPFIFIFMWSCQSAATVTLGGGNGSCGQQPLGTLYVGLGLLGFLALVLIGLLLMDVDGLWVGISPHMWAVGS